MNFSGYRLAARSVLSGDEHMVAPRSRLEDLLQDSLHARR
jgi:hypothetical protein